MQRNDKATCWTCPYWVGSSNMFAAKCRRRHPEELAIDEGTASTWFDTNPDDWCGEHPNFQLTGKTTRAT